MVLGRPGHDGRVYDITTPEAVTLAELARIASDATGRLDSYEPGADEDWIRRWRGRTPGGSRPG